MYQTKQIHYKAIFKQDHDQHKIEYKAKGLFHQIKKQVLILIHLKDIFKYLMMIRKCIYNMEIHF